MTDILSQFRDEDLPPSTVDIGGAVRSGRRRRRIRTGLVAGVMAVAVAVAVGTPIWLFARPAPPPPIVPACGSPEPSRQSLPNWERFDPLSLEIDASGVTDHRVVIAVTSTYGQAVQLETVGADRDPGITTTIMLFACGSDLGKFDSALAGPFDPAAGEPADPIGGVPAFWLPPNTLRTEGHATEALAWEWTPGAWVIVMAQSDPDTSTGGPTALRTIAARVAPQLELGVGTPVTSPISLPMPDDTYVSITVTQMASDFGQQFPVGFRVGFNTVGTEESRNLYVDSPNPSLAVDVSAFRTVNDRPADATEYPEDLGYPAYQAVINEGGPDIDALLVYEFFGLGLQIMAAEPPGASTRDEKLSRAAEIFRTITVYPGAASDRSAWGDLIVP